jgi:predicted transcriptional regulator
MNRTFLIFLLTAFLNTGTAWPQAAPGGSKSITVTPANILEQPFGFRVSTRTNMLGLPSEDTIRFTVEVTERDQPIPPESEGSLWVASGHEFITRLNVDPKRDGKTLTYEFDLARRFIEKDTSFMFVAVRTSINPVGREFKLGDFYSFALPQFATK